MESVAKDEIPSPGLDAQKYTTSLSLTFMIEPAHWRQGSKLVKRIASVRYFSFVIEVAL